MHLHRRLLLVLGFAVLELFGVKAEAFGRGVIKDPKQPWRLRELRNFRDAGAALGLPAGRIFRSDDPRHRPFRACERLQAANIRSIVKLNAEQGHFRPGRRPQWKRGTCGLPELRVSIPYERTEGAHGVNIYAIGRPRSRSAARRRVVSDLETQIGLLFRELAHLRPTRLPVLFHCSVGRDRTGVVLALLALASGARLAQVEADYLASGASVGNTSVMTLRRVLGRVGPIPEYFRRHLGLSVGEIHRLRRLVRGSGAAADATVPPTSPTSHFGPP